MCRAVEMYFGYSCKKRFSAVLVERPLGSKRRMQKHAFVVVLRGTFEYNDNVQTVKTARKQCIRSICSREK